MQYINENNKLKLTETQTVERTFTLENIKQSLENAQKRKASIQIEIDKWNTLLQFCKDNNVK